MKDIISAAGRLQVGGIGKHMQITCKTVIIGYMSDKFYALLKINDLKVTSARLAVLSFLEVKKVPVDAMEIEIYLRRKKIAMNQSTIYRILSAFVKKGIVIEIELGEGKSRFELASLPHHHHAVCTECGMIEDITYRGKEALEKLFKPKTRFIIKSHSLEFFGVCAKCQ